MTKPRAIQWLEEQTGETLDYTAEASPAQERHLSVRLSAELATGLGAIAAERGLSVSQVVRQILTEAVGQRSVVADLDSRALADRLAADVAEVRRRLAG